MIEYFQIIPVSSTSISTSYPPLHAEAFAHPSVRPITRCAQQHVPAWSHGCMWVKSWLLHNDIHRHQAAAWLFFLMLLLTLYMFLPLHLSIVACCCNHGFQRSKGQRCFYFFVKALNTWILLSSESVQPSARPTSPSSHSAAWVKRWGPGRQSPAAKTSALLVCSLGSQKFRQKHCIFTYTINFPIQKCNCSMSRPSRKSR